MTDPAVSFIELQSACLARRIHMDAPG